MGKTFRSRQSRSVERTIVDRRAKMEAMAFIHTDPTQ